MPHFFAILNISFINLNSALSVFGEYTVRLHHAGGENTLPSPLKKDVALKMGFGGNGSRAELSQIQMWAVSS